MRISLILFLLLFISCNNQQENSNGAESSLGKDYYQKLCTSCHGKKGNLKISNAADLSISNLSQDSVLDIIKNGKGTMPAFSRYLNEEQILQVADYCMTLRKPN